MNFPTKQHWRSPSQMAWVESGLHDLRRFIVEHDLKSVAIPALGAGNGGLDWQKVRPLITEILADLPGVQVEVFEPIV
ncbi:macro domain-containing protein [Roseateles sp. UC29_93]|uniref:macro domain-containing protein n=1 Tax=Roseateles sp. UC29_93 TaxID=3350177 RepID=UPI00366FDF0D